MEDDFLGSETRRTARFATRGFYELTAWVCM